MVPDRELIARLPSVVPEDVWALVKRLQDQAHGVWVVGGALRDYFLGLTPKDWDLATTAPPETVMRLFPHVVPIGIRHGTVQVQTSDRGVEITSLPPAGEASILGDLSRRDFTVNAMALSLQDGRFLDPHGGLRDIASRTLRAVLDARARFREDPLRTLRAGRLVSTHGFRLEEESLRGLAAECAGLAHVAPERIRDEICKLLMGEHLREGIMALRKGGVWPQVLPELNGSRVFQHTAATVVHCPPRLRLRLSALLHALGWDAEHPASLAPIPCHIAAHRSAELAEGVLHRWRASRRDIREVGLIVRHQLPLTSLSANDADLRRWMAKAGKDALEDLLDLARAEGMATAHQPSPGSDAACPSADQIETLLARIQTVLRQNPPLTIQQLAVTGEDVMRLLRLGPGPLVGTLLRRLHDHVLEEPQRNTAAVLSQILEREYSQRQRETLK
ncbi:MAG: CCA tRNA nucleotidyltransferase [Syntrophobacteraceae bacterium]